MNAARITAWLTRANAALAAFTRVEDANPGVAGTLGYGSIVSALTTLNGWSDPDALAYLDALRALRNPDHGYGINEAWDPFGDGSVNPATTSYTVSMADHVGMMFLDGWRAGVIPTLEVQQLVTCLLGVHQFVTPTGTCLAYSTSTSDWATTGPRSLYQVHNVNALAARFFFHARGMGFTGIPAKLILGQTRHLAAAWNPTWSGWPYSAAVPGVVQDRDHQSATAAAVHDLAPMIGRECAYMLMTTTGTGALDPIAHMRLTSLSTDGDAGNSNSALEPGESDWLVKGDQWAAAEFDAFVVAQEAAGAADRLAQAAKCAADNWLAA